MRNTGFTLIALLLLIAQVANAQTTRPESDNYWMPTDVQPVGGGEAAKSTNYSLDDTIGESNIGASRSDTYDLGAGYRQTVGSSYLALGCTDTITIGEISITGRQTGSGTCVVTTDSEAGYSLSWNLSTGSGGTNTGYMINQTEDVIPPFQAKTDGLVGHWRLDEASAGGAGSVVDSSDNDNNGTPTGTTASADIPADVNFRTERSRDFNGSSDYINLGNDASLNLNNNLTVSAWIKVSPSASGNGMAILVWGEDSDAKRRGMVLWNGGSGPNKVYWSGYGMPSNIAATTSVADDEWHHVAATVTAGNVVTMYVDGVEENSDTAVHNAFNYSNTYIGSSQLVGDGGGEFFDGLIDDVRLYNRVLTAAEIKALYSEPQSWSVPSTEAAWGGRLSSRSDDDDAKWGTDGSSDKWLNVGDGDYPVVTRTSQTDLDGSAEILEFRAEVGAQVIQPTGLYEATITLTATSL